MGLVSRVVRHERRREKAIAVAESILRTAPEAREGMRALADERPPNGIPRALETGKRLERGAALPPAAPALP